MSLARLLLACLAFSSLACSGSGNAGPVEVTPASAVVATHGSMTFVASGGQPPYAFAFTDNASRGVIDQLGNYIAGDHGGVMDVITLTDATGASATATITVRDNPLQITPARATIKPFGAVTFTASGGSGAGYQFRVTSTPALGSITPQGAYLADADQPGDDTVTLTDSFGHTATATIHIAGTLAISPLFSSIKAGDSLSFTATGGQGPLTFSLAANASGGTITADGQYRAGARTGSDVIRVTDGSGATGQATAYVFGAPDDGYAIAPHATESVVDKGGGALTHPVLVGIHWSNDPYRTQIAAFGQYLMDSAWLAQVGAEYGVTGGSYVDVSIPSAAPTDFSDGDAQEQLSEWIDDGTLPKDASGQLIYMLFIPASTRYVDNGANLCDYSGGGYHNESLASDGTPFAYAIVSPCPEQGVSARSVLEIAGSHELIEAITDAFWLDHPGFRVPNAKDPWALLGSEVGDLCSYVPPVNVDGHTLTEVFSNAAARAGGSPCVPPPSRYFTVDITPKTMQPVAAGQSVTFTLDGWSTSAVGSWMLYASPYGPAAGYRPFNPDVQLSQMTLTNGGQATLTVTVPNGTPRGSGTFIFIDSYFNQVDGIGALAGVYVP